MGTSISAVSAESPNTRRSMLATTCCCRAQARGHARRGVQFDAVPLAVVEGERVALVASRRASARQVEESRPPLSRQTAFFVAPWRSPLVVIEEAFLL